MGENPVVYSLTEAGETTELDNEEKIWYNIIIR
jgi:hypothetical protein